MPFVFRDDMGRWGSKLAWIFLGTKVYTATCCWFIFQVGLLGLVGLMWHELMWGFDQVSERNMYWVGLKILSGQQKTVRLGKTTCINKASCMAAAICSWNKSNISLEPEWVDWIPVFQRAQKQGNDENSRLKLRGKLGRCGSYEASLLAINSLEAAEALALAASYNWGHRATF